MLPPNWKGVLEERLEKKLLVVEAALVVVVEVRLKEGVGKDALLKSWKLEELLLVLSWLVVDWVVGGAAKDNWLAEDDLAPRKLFCDVMPKPGAGKVALVVANRENWLLLLLLLLEEVDVVDGGKREVAAFLLPPKREVVVLPKRGLGALPNMLLTVAAGVVVVVTLKPACVAFVAKLPSWKALVDEDTGGIVVLVVDEEPKNALLALFEAAVAPKGTAVVVAAKMEVVEAGAPKAGKLLVALPKEDVEVAAPKGREEEEADLLMPPNEKTGAEVADGAKESAEVVVWMAEDEGVMLLRAMLKKEEVVVVMVGGADVVICVAAVVGRDWLAVAPNLKPPKLLGVEKAGVLNCEEKEGRLELRIADDEGLKPPAAAGAAGTAAAGAEESAGISLCVM